MTNPEIMQLGAGGVLALLIIREVIGFLGKRTNGGVTREFCDERNKHINESLARIENKQMQMDQKIDALPSRINGKMQN